MKSISYPKIILSFLIILQIIELFSTFSIDSTKRFILDNYGRYTIFHGGNVVVKLPPYLPTTDEFDYQMSINTPHDLETMKRLGFNSVRLGVIWESVETAPGVYDYDYLDKIENIINTLGLMHIKMYFVDISVEKVYHIFTSKKWDLTKNAMQVL